MDEDQAPPLQMMKKAEPTRARARSSTGPTWSLQQRLKLEILISDLSAGLLDLRADSADSQIRRAFNELLNLLKIDRVMLWAFSEDQSELVLHHSRNTKTKNVPSSSPSVTAKQLRWMRRELLRAEIVVLQNVGDVPKGSHELEHYFSEQGIRSWLALPVRNKGAVFGALIFESIHHEAQWDSRLTARLQIFADMFGSTLAGRRAKQSQQHSESLKNSILDSLNSNVAVIDGKGIILAVNTKWAQFSADGGSSSLVQGGVGVNYLDFCRLKSEAHPALDGIQSVLNGSRSVFELEYPRHSQTEQRWFRMIVNPLALPVGGALISHRDVTNGKRADRENEERFRKMTDELPIIIWMHGPKKNFGYVNKAGLEFSGLSMEDYCEDKWLNLIHPEDVEKQWSTYAKAFDARQRFMMEYRHLHNSGQYRWLLSHGAPQFLPDGSFAGYIGVSLDIHDQKEAEQARVGLAGRLLRAQEEERSRVARELHDDVTQRLALLTIKLHQFEQTLADSDERRCIESLRKHTNQLALDVSQVSHRLHSSHLESLGLAAAVENLCQEMSEQHHVDAECSIKDVPRVLNFDIALSLFRIIQEALRNVVKHSHASKVKVELFANATEISLQVSDDGVGFDTTALVDREGLGLLSMKERARLVGGDFSIWSKPSNGTQLQTCIPLMRSVSNRSLKLAA